MSHQHLMRFTLLFALLMMLMNGSHSSWNIGSKSRVNGSAIHSVYFITPDNAPIPVSAEAYVGVGEINGICPYTAVYQLGTETLKTGDTFYIDGNQLKNLISGGYTCMSIYYTYKQLIVDSFKLIFDGVNYINSTPSTDEVVIL